MNERIKLLWEEAAKTTQGDSWEEQTKFMERYTELVVRECADIADRRPNVLINQTVGGWIKQHFGVE